jgi:hypothetical protein
MLSDRKNVEAILADTMLRARIIWVWEQGYLEDVVSEVTSRHSHQDDDKSIAAATERHGRALRKYLKAVKELADLALNGIMPARFLMPTQLGYYAKHAHGRRRH